MVAPYSRRQAGVALPLVLMVSTVVLLLAVAMLRYTTSDLTFSTAERSKTRAFYAAEMGLARGYDKIKSDFLSGRLVTLQPNIVFTGTSADDTGNTAEEKKLPDETFSTSGNYYESTVTTPDGQYRLRYSIADAPWLMAAPTATRVYAVEAVARDLNRGTWAGLRSSFTVTRTMLYFYGVFFKDDLEINPSPTMTFAGPVHTNKNMFLWPDSTLTFDSELTAAGHIMRARKENGSNSGGTIKINRGDGVYVEMKKDGSNDAVTTLSGYTAGDLSDPSKGDGQPNPADTWKVDPNWRQSAIDTWDGRVRDASHGVTEQTPPQVESIDRGGFYEQKAGLKIITNSSGTTTIYKADGSTIMPSSLGSNNPISTSTFYNSREKKTITTTNIDMAKLKTAGLFPTNGTIYASREDAKADANPLDTTPDTSRKPNGIKLINSASLPDAMTLVTNDPLYVQGDFNKHVDTAGKKPGQSGYNAANDKWKPAALLSDSMTVLSNSWSDSANASANGRAASSTEFNAITVTGNRNTNTTEGYSGGLENFPRFIEDWGGDTLTMRGSFIQLWNSRFGTGKWSDTVYQPPGRDWGYDNAFGTSAIPPGFADLFPSITRAVTQGKWQQLKPGEALLSI